MRGQYFGAMKATDKKRLLDLLNSFQKTKILVIGDFILDQFVWGSVDRISPEAPVPVVNVQRESYMPGGSLNVANNIHNLGGTVLPCGVVGRDLQGRMLVKVIRREGIDIGGIVYDASRPTAVKTRVIAHSQQVVRFDREKIESISVQARKKILHFVRNKIRDVDTVLIEDYGKGVIQPQLLREIVQLAQKHRKPVLVDPKEKHFSYYKGVTAITPNRKEAYGALENFGVRCEEDDPEEVGRKLLRKLKCDAVLMTLGEDGMALFQKRGALVKVPTFAQEVYDVSGAGDTVIGVFSLAVSVGASMKDAAILSNLAAGIVVGKLGTATIHPGELREAIENATKSPKKSSIKRRSRV